MVRKLILVSCLLITGCVTYPSPSRVYVNPVPVPLIREHYYVCDRWIERGHGGRMYRREYCYWIPY